MRAHDVIHASGQLSIRYIHLCMQEGRETTAEVNKAKKLSKNQELASGKNNKQNARKNKHRKQLDNYHIHDL